MSDKCPKCDGKGYLYIEPSCPNCHGLGVIAEDPASLEDLIIEEESSKPKVYFGPVVSCMFCTGDVSNVNHVVKYEDKVYHPYCLCLELTKRLKEKDE